MDSKDPGSKDLKLCGEQINLINRSRFADDAKKQQNKFRPRSALYTTTKNPPENTRRPFSAGTEPKSPKLHSFLRRSNIEKADPQYIRNSEFFRDSLSIPGTTESALLCDKLINDPINDTTDFIRQKYSFNLPTNNDFNYDNISENSSTDTCASPGPKIKVKIDDGSAIIDDNYEIEGNSIKLKKIRPRISWSTEKLFEEYDTKKTECIPSEKDVNTKLSIFVPNVKDENTSSGISSASDMNYYNVQRRTKDDNDLLKDMPMTPNRPIKSKKNGHVSINWIPQNIPKFKDAKEDRIYNENNLNNDFDAIKKADNLAGRVSFGKNHFEKQIQSSIHSTYDTQLSLVEEESSQDSDISTKLLSASYNAKMNAGYLDDGCLKYREPLSIYENDEPIEINYKSMAKSNNVQFENNGVSEYLVEKDNHFTNKHLINEFDKIKYENNDLDEKENKFRALEEKYRNEKLRLSSTINDCNAFKQNNSCSSYSLSVLENHVSKDTDDNVKRNISGSELHDYIINRSDAFDNMHSSSNKINLSTALSDFNKESSGLIDVIANKPVVNYVEENKRHDDHTQQQSSLLNNNEDKKVQICNSFDERNDIAIQEVIINEESPKEELMERETIIFKGQESETDILKLNDDKHNEYSTVNITNKSTCESECDQRDMNSVANYPIYLEKNDSKSYTSKVIEEYKREIASINNYHDLTIKDLRKKCDVLKSHMKSESPEPVKKRVVFSSSGEDEDIEEIVLSDHRRKYNINNKLQENPKSTLNHRFLYPQHERYQSSVKIGQTGFSDKEKSILDSMMAKQKNKNNRPKLRKKIKKKESITVNTVKNPNETKQIIPKKNVLESKKLPENNLNGKKNKGIMKFKAQKISLSKCTTKINHTVYIDNDKDVDSWMATRVYIPPEENSSSENFDTNRLHTEIKEKPNIKINLNHDTVYYEKDIIPVIKSSSASEMLPFSDDLNIHNARSVQSTSSSLGQREKQSTDSSSTMQPMHFSSEIANFTPSVDSDFIMNKNRGENELNDLIEDNSMVADIFSALKDVNTHKGIHEMNNGVVSKLSEETDESMTAEYKDIITFLERVEKNANEEMSSLSHNQPPFALKVEELMDLSKAELAHRAVVGALAAGKAISAAAGLREALAKAARASNARLRAAQATARQQSAVGAAQAAQSLNRHQKFIEQLVTEKKALTERIEQLAGAAAGAEARRGRAARSAAERLQLELRNQRQRLTAAHQRDKQAWLKHHTQKIKEMTVKGLEGELQDIEKNHAAQLVKSQQNGELAIADIKEQHAKELRKLKETMARQAEDELDKERLLAAERLERKRVEWEAALAKAAERAGQEAREAAQRAEEIAKNARLQADMWKMEQEEDLSRQRANIEKQAEERRNAMMEEFSLMREKLNGEFEGYKEEHNKKQIKALKEKEIEIRALMRRERDREIEKAIDCMEMEAEGGRKDMQDAVRRIKEKYENDIGVLEESEKVANQRCKETREQLREIQELYAVSQIKITQLEGKLKQAEELINQNSIQTEMLIRAAEMKGRENADDLRAQIQNLQQQHKDEMHQLFAKVKVVVARKDDAVTLARREVTNLRERCMRLEARLTPS